MIRFLSFFCFVFVSFVGFAQVNDTLGTSYMSYAASSGQDGARRFRVMEYNVENLFDTIPSLEHDDADFLPTGAYRWDGARYWRKLSALARVMLEAGEIQPVDLIGLCEVENDSVVCDLIHRSRLAALGYDYAMTDSKDVRGIDVALLYQPETFRLLTQQSFPVPYKVGKERPTRDVLLCSGVLPTGDTLDVAVVHFPSRRGGASATDGYRLRAAGLVKQLADSVKAVREHPAFLMMGDCNASPADPCLRLLQHDGYEILTANPQFPKHIAGTYYYKKEWSQIDNILVNADFAFSLKAPCRVFAPDYLLEKDRNGYPFPRRTYRGPSYHGGTSDHLPLLLDFWY